MKNKITIFIISLLLCVGIIGITFGARTQDVLFNQVGDNLLLRNVNWELGSSIVRIAKIWLTDLDTTNIKIGGVSSGDLDMDSHIITNIGNANSDFEANGGMSMSGRIFITGRQDETQLTVKGYSTQTNDIILFEKSDGTDLFTLDNSGNTAFGIANATSTITGGMDVDGGTLFVDPYDDRVGIGTVAPTGKLSVTQTSGELIDFTHGTTHMLTILDERRTRFATSSVVYFGSMNDKIIDNMEATTLVWTQSGSTTTSTEATIVKMGDQALKITSTWACEDDLINKTISESWAAYERMGFWIYSDRIATTTATTTQMISIELIDSTNGTFAHDITIQAEDQWQYEEWALNATGTTAYDGVTDLQFRIDANTTTTNFYIDQIRLYNENERAAEFFVDASGNLNLFSPNAIEFTRAVPGGSLPSIKIDSAIVEVNQPFAVNVAGDVGINYDLYFAGTGASAITSAGPFTISAGDANHAENLTLTTNGQGDIIIDIADSRFGLKAIGNSNLAYVNRLYPEGELEVRNTLYSDMKFIDIAGYWNGSSFTTTTDEINSYQGTAQTLLADTNDFFYWGATSTDGFTRLYFDLNAVATTTLALDWEYSTGAQTWSNLQNTTTTDDSADGFESDGNIDWTIPGDWAATTSFGGIATSTDAHYLVRVSTDTTGWTTAPTAYYAALSRYGGDFARFTTDGTDKFRIDKDGDLYVAGKIGIATSTPAMELDIYDGLMRANKTSTTTCNSTIRGAIFFHDVDKHFYGCDGTNWLKLNN